MRSGWARPTLQGTPFNDSIFSDLIVEISEEGKPNTKLTIDGTTPHMIYRYGFYQGGLYRTEPRAIIDFFNLKQKGEDPWVDCEKS